MSWEKIKLEDLCTSITDGDHQSLPLTDTGIPFIVIANINNVNRIDFEKARYVPYEYYEKLDFKRKPEKGDVLLTVKGSFGIPVYVDTDKPFVFQRDIAIFKCNEKTNPMFLFYYMKNRSFYLYADSIAIGSAQRALTLKVLKNTIIAMPSLDEQNKIVALLAPYDSLIKNNLEQIKLLEEAAQRLYKEWFIDLRFPGYEDVEIIDGIPEGWKRKTVGEVIDKPIRAKQIKASDYLKEGSIPVIDQSRDFIAGYTNDNESVVQRNVPIIVFGDHTRILKYISFPFAKGADGTQLILSKDECIPQAILFLALMNIDLSNYHYARHFKYLKAEEVLISSKNIAAAFEKIVNPIFEQIQTLRNMMMQATEARDRLLPKLMSGELEV